MLNPEQVVDQYYLQMRCKLIEIAAILDRYDRAAAASAADSAQSDTRWQRCREALQLLEQNKQTGDTTNRAEQLAMIFSDPVQ